MQLNPLQAVRVVMAAGVAVMLAFRATGAYWLLVVHWVLILPFVALMFLVMPYTWCRLGWLVVLCGAAANALVMLANGGMPVPDADYRGLGPWWKPASECRYFLWLGDNYLGYSIGDVLLWVGLIVMGVGWVRAALVEGETKE